MRARFFGQLLYCSAQVPQTTTRTRIVHIDVLCYNTSGEIFSQRSRVLYKKHETCHSFTQQRHLKKPWYFRSTAKKAAQKGWKDTKEITLRDDIPRLMTVLSQCAVWHGAAEAYYLQMSHQVSFSNKRRSSSMTLALILNDVC